MSGEGGATHGGRQAGASLVSEEVPSGEGAGEGSTGPGGCILIWRQSKNQGFGARATNSTYSVWSVEGQARLSGELEVEDPRLYSHL